MMHKDSPTTEIVKDFQHNVRQPNNAVIMAGLAGAALGAALGVAGAVVYSNPRVRKTVATGLDNLKTRINPTLKEYFQRTARQIGAQVKTNASDFLAEVREKNKQPVLD